MPISDFDEAVVLRALEGDRTVLGARGLTAERVEIVRRAKERGWTYSDIERITGITKPDRYVLPGPESEAS